MILRSPLSHPLRNLNLDGELFHRPKGNSTFSCTLTKDMKMQSYAHQPADTLEDIYAWLLMDPKTPTVRCEGSCFRASVALQTDTLQMCLAVFWHRCFRLVQAWPPSISAARGDNKTPTTNNVPWKLRSSCGKTHIVLAGARKSRRALMRRAQYRADGKGFGEEAWKLQYPSQDDRLCLDDPKALFCGATYYLEVQR